MDEPTPPTTPSSTPPTTRATPEPSPGDPVALAQRQRRMAHIIYGLQAVGVFVGLLGIVAVILAYVRRRREDAGLLRTHFTWQIRSFWGALVASVIGSIMFGAFSHVPAGQLGLLLIVGAAIWLLYRVIRGWIGLYDSKPMYDLFPR